MGETVMIVGEPIIVGELIFKNSDARPKVVEIQCNKDSVPHIMTWYGGYFAGDKYSVTWNGEKVPKDNNGEPIDWQ
jgi:hypothetical protein